MFPLGFILGAKTHHFVGSKMNIFHLRSLSNLLGYIPFKQKKNYGLSIFYIIMHHLLKRARCYFEFPLQKIFTEVLVYNFAFNSLYLQLQVNINVSFICWPTMQISSYLSFLFSGKTKQTDLIWAEFKVERIRAWYIPKGHIRIIFITTAFHSAWFLLT